MFSASSFLPAFTSINFENVFLTHFLFTNHRKEKPTMSANTESRSTEAQAENESEDETDWVSETESEFLREPCLRNWLELPRDLTASILLRLGAIEIIETAQKVCTQWRSICKDPSMWRVIDMRNPGDLHDFDMPNPYSLETICRRAVDHSAGGLVDINIEYFGTDDLLAYITQRTSQLKRVRLVGCRDISDEGLSEAASKLPLLEELEIYGANTSKESIEAVGRSCPLLKTFKYNQQGIRNPRYVDDGEALAIAQNMQGLRHLQLIGNCLTNIGLQAIFDGCPHLESLDLRKCFHVNLDGPLGKKCAEQIKNLRRPNDSTRDFRFIAEAESYGYYSGESDSNYYCEDYYRFIAEAEGYGYYSGGSEYNYYEDFGYDGHDDDVNPFWVSDY